MRLHAEPLEEAFSWLDGTCLVMAKQAVYDAPTVELQGRYLVITTDGTSLDDYAFYDDLKEAQENMRNAYEWLKPENWDKEYRAMSSCNEMDAILFRNGEDILLWNIIPLLKEGKED